MAALEPSSTKLAEPTIRPSLSPKLKPPIFPKPALGPKPNVVPESVFTATHSNSLPLAKPIPAPKSKYEQVSLFLGKEKVSLDLDSKVEQKFSEARNVDESHTPNTQVNSVAPASSDTSTEENHSEHSFSNTTDLSLFESKLETVVPDVTPSPVPISSINMSSTITRAPTLSFVKSSLISTSESGSNDRTDNVVNSFSCSKGNRANCMANERRKSTSFLEQKMSVVSNVTTQNLMTVKDDFATYVNDNTTANMKVSASQVYLNWSTETVPAKPDNAMLIPAASNNAETSLEKLTSPHPRPMPLASRSLLTVSLNHAKLEESLNLHVPRRPARAAQTNHSLTISTPAPPHIANKSQQHSPTQAPPHTANKPQRHSPRSASFPSTPKRPPPRPTSFRFPDGLKAEDETDLELVAGLTQKLEEIQATIKTYEEARSDLQRNLQEAYTQSKEKEIQLHLERVEKQLDDLQEEEQDLKENLFAANSEESKLEKSRLLAAQSAVEEERKRDEEEKHREEEERRKEEEKKRAVEIKAKKRIQREKVIEELLNTEKDYLYSLNLCLETFYDDQKPPDKVDLDFLLGNMEEIGDVSQKMLIRLENCVSGKSFEEQCLGRVFIELADDMKNTYAPYCRNHDEVITAMEQYTDSTEINNYFKTKIETMKKQTNVFDMASILIRPVQRILKYPLLLNELLKNTDEGHPDREDIVAAIKEMTEVAKTINEYKRRKDLVYKYRNFTDETFSDKISKLNFHSIKKKSARMRGRLSTNFGIALQIKNEIFEKEEGKFRHMERTVKVFLSSVQEYLEQSLETVHSLTVFVDDIKDFYQGRECPESTKLYEVTCKQLSLFDGMKATVENNVVVPLNILVTLFSGPTMVIEKRFDKMLDYNYQLGKMENDKELQAAKNDYEAMNAQLLDELPKFYKLAFKMLRHCISVFILARRDFMDQSLRESCAMLELPSMASKANLMETFKIRHTTAFDHMSMLSFIPKGFNPRVDTVKADRVKQKVPGNPDSRSQRNHSLQASSGSQNENRRKYLHQIYPPDKLYNVTATYNAVDLMDISVTEGSLVGVVKELDPMGNVERWFVDDGGSKGFIPRGILTPLEHFQQESSADIDDEDDIISILSGDSGDSLVLTGNDDRVDFHTNNSFVDSFSQQPQLPQYQYYYALYDFKSRHVNEASLTAGHPVTVLAFHDLDGNSEWWLVDSEGKRGYAPANYMAPMAYS